jgi:hypothetical protein
MLPASEPRISFPSQPVSAYVPSLADLSIFKPRWSDPWFRILFPLYAYSPRALWGLLDKSLNCSSFGRLSCLLHNLLHPLPILQQHPRWGSNSRYSDCYAKSPFPFQRPSLPSHSCANCPVTAGLHPQHQSLENLLVRTKLLLPTSGPFFSKSFPIILLSGFMNSLTQDTSLNYFVQYCAPFFLHLQQPEFTVW